MDKTKINVRFVLFKNEVIAVFMGKDAQRRWDGTAYGFGRGMFGRRAFGGRGFRNWFHGTGQPGWMGYGAYPGAYPPAAPAPMTPEQEQDELKAQEAWLQEQLDAVRGQLNKEQD